LAHRSDDDPVAGQIDRVLVALLYGRQLPPGKWPVEWVLGPFTLDGHDGPVMAVEVAEHGIRVLAVHLDVLLPRQRVALAAIRRPRVAQEVDEEVRQKVGQQFFLVQLVGAAGADQVGPMCQLGPHRVDAFRQRERDQMLVHHVGPE